MPDKDDIVWFKESVGPGIVPLLEGTPFDLDMMTALACQETGSIWPVLRRKGLPLDEILRLCVGDTLDDSKGRRAFPRNKAELVGFPRGQAMFDLARERLVAMAEHIDAFKGVAKKSHKFCRGFGLFQHDLQHFRTDPEHFLDRRFERLDGTVGKALEVLKMAVRVRGLEGRPALSEREFAETAIVYNTGKFDPKKGLRQGHPVGTRFFGEMILDFLLLARTITPGRAPRATSAGVAILPRPRPVTASGPDLIVDTMINPLNLRSTPEILPGEANVEAKLPDGHRVRAVGDRSVNGFREIETILLGALLRGFSDERFLKPAPGGGIIAPPLPRSVGERSLPSVLMPRREGHVTRRAEIAGAHSLNEPDQPGRAGLGPTDLVADLARIVDWLDVENDRHLRYLPRKGLTFCNIYAHDFCHLAKAYLPRVWWTGEALLKIAAGEVVVPKIGATIREMRANALFDWLTDFGADFDWRRTGTTATLQQAVNQGGIGLIVAKRKDIGRSGHITVVLPETSAIKARRDADGTVLAPVQSQAGIRNVRIGTLEAGWWRDEKFEDRAFWIHP